MESWYVEYFAQTWYANTFLVRRPEQIGRAIDGDRDWNSIYDSGCNFVCLAIIAGIDPARMASALASTPFFCADSSLPAVTLTGKRGGLVWDGNRPHEADPGIRLPGLWHPHLNRREHVTIRLVRIDAARDHETGKAIVARAVECNLHVICGPEEHSHLVAGRIGTDYFLWDPDDTVVSVEANMRGRCRLKSLFTNGQEVEFWQYEATFT